MKKSDSIKELAIALSKCQAKMGNAIKDSSNPFFKSKYADLSSVCAALAEPMAANGLSKMQFVENGEGNQIKLTTIIMHCSGEWIESEFLYQPQKTDIQSIGSLITYLRRYCLSSIMGVSPADDDGEAAMVRQQPTVAPQAITEKQRNSCRRNGWNGLETQNGTSYRRLLLWLN